MNTSFAVWIVILLSLVLANLPFLSNRFLGVVRRTSKPLGLRLAELLLGYTLAGGLAWALEARLGAVAPQGWEFYAVTFALFLTFAFPGFVYRYLYRKA